MLKGLDLTQTIKSGFIGGNNSPYISFKVDGANKCAFNFTGVDPSENETLAEFLDRTSSDVNLEEWSSIDENGESHPHRNFVIRMSFE